MYSMHHYDEHKLEMEHGCNRWIQTTAGKLVMWINFVSWLYPSHDSFHNCPEHTITAVGCYSCSLSEIVLGTGWKGRRAKNEQRFTSLQI